MQHSEVRQELTLEDFPGMPSPQEVSCYLSFHTEGMCLFVEPPHKAYVYYAENLGLLGP